MESKNICQKTETTLKLARFLRTKEEALEKLREEAVVKMREDQADIGRYCSEPVLIELGKPIPEFKFPNNAKQYDADLFYIHYIPKIIIVKLFDISKLRYYVAYHSSKKFSKLSKNINRFLSLWSFLNVTSQDKHKAQKYIKNWYFIIL